MRALRLLLLVDSFPPDMRSAGVLVAELAAELVCQGHRVLLVTPSSFESAGVDQPVASGVRIFRAKAFSTKNIGLARRAFAELALPILVGLRAWREIRQFDPEGIVYYSPTIFWGPLVWWLRRRLRVRTLLVLRDLFPQWAIDMGVLGNSLLIAFFRFFERWQYAAADVVAVQSRADLRYFSGRRAIRARVEVLYNWVQESRPAGDSRAKAILGLEGKIVFIYGGNIGRAQALDQLIEAADRLGVRDDIHFVVIGEGSERERLQRAVTSRKLGNVTILPPVEPDQFAAAIRDFDVGVLTLHPRLRTSNIPGKLLSYLSVALPVLASVNDGNELLNLLPAYSAGICVASGDLAALCSAIERLADDARLRSELAAGGKRLLGEVFSASGAAAEVVRMLSDDEAYRRNK